MTLPASGTSADVAPSPAPSIEVRPAREDDLPRTARVHRRCLPGGFFARLGTRFLRHYHATFAASSRATLLVAEDHGEVLGFLAGTTDNAAHYRTVVRRRSVRLLLSGVAAMARDRALASEFVRTRVARYARAIARQLRARRGPVPPAEAPAAPTVAVLTHVAVTEDARGSGAGRALVAAFTRRAREAGADEVRLVTAADGGARTFYRRLGWSSRGTRRAADGTFVEEFARRP
ncbi:GNAT family N-acetyltransferase [Nitriliruptor alkaliphilus]|uniref:GNAT family N-acetyltransferase n=1 Tax=Nitriliruptor alkaliphilus TaxID=427918 RepID=UPI00069869B9|nr:GNAT family N-acetyltransferase [Nitriliruptor alkaliphilus]